jgi:4-amino-4-deoxy-L-arabinose transferase-like glycosyltransferase
MSARGAEAQVAATHGSRTAVLTLCSAACAALLFAGAGLNLWFLIDGCRLDLSGDEAHYWEWSRHLDISYYSKGPLVAWIIAGSRALIGEWSRQMVGSEALAVRIPGVLLAVFTGAGVFVLALRTTRRPTLALAATALLGTIPILATGSILMTIDAPLMCAWVWALVLLHAGLEDGSMPAWCGAGLFVAAGILAKYTMVLIYPVVGLTLLLDPAARERLRQAGPYVAGVIGLLGFVPILIWNAAHDWVSFRHVAGQAGLSHGGGFNPVGPLAYATGQFAVVGPWLIVMVLAIHFALRSPAKMQHGLTGLSCRFLLLSAILPWAFFAPFSLIAKIQPNWPVAALPAAAILAVVWIAAALQHERATVRTRATVLACVCSAVGLLLVVLSRHTEWLMPLFQRLAQGAPAWQLTPAARYDPAARLRGWSELGRSVGQELEALRTAGRQPFILSDDYQVASEIAFYAPGNPPTYCVQAALGDRKSQYDLWHGPLTDAAAFVGRPVIYVGGRHPRLTGERGGRAALPEMKPLQRVEHLVAGARLQVWTIFYSDHFAGFEPANFLTEKY